MELNLLIIIIALTLVSILVSFLFPRNKEEKTNTEINSKLSQLDVQLQKMDQHLKDDFRINRDESNQLATNNRKELNETLLAFRNETGQTLKTISQENINAIQSLNKTLEEKLNTLIEKSENNFSNNRREMSDALKSFSESNNASLEKIRAAVEQKLTELTTQAKEDNTQIRNSLNNVFKDFQAWFDNNVKSFNDLQREKFAQLENKQDQLIKSTEERLETMRQTVDEKLQKTLNERLGQSFELVGKQLESVQKGLGEMQTLAQDVGGLKRVLSNVKIRGGIGEVQLEMLLEQILAREQYEPNVKTKQGSSDVVEFAIKLPGREDADSKVWLPIDAKFPKDVYEQLQSAYDTADIVQIELAQKNMENTIRKMAKDIHDKYIDPPNTTDFGIMFLPFEGIYAEVVRKASLLEDLQRNYKIIVTGPTTLAAILNSLQMGFRTLVIQKRSSEVWKVLGAVKKEFEVFGGLMEKAQSNIQTGLNQLDDVMGKRTRAINRKLKDVEILSGTEAKLILPDATDADSGEEES